MRDGSTTAARGVNLRRIPRQGMEIKVSQVKLSESAQALLRDAESRARAMGQDYIGTEHVLLALAHNEPTTRAALLRVQVKAAQVDEAIARIVGKAACPTVVQDAPLRWSPRLQRAMERYATSNNIATLDPADLFAAIVQDEHCAATRALVTIGVDLDAIR